MANDNKEGAKSVPELIDRLGGPRSVLNLGAMFASRIDEELEFMETDVAALRDDTADLRKIIRRMDHTDRVILRSLLKLQNQIVALRARAILNDPALREQDPTGFLAERAAYEFLAANYTPVDISDAAIFAPAPEAGRE